METTLLLFAQIFLGLYTAGLILLALLNAARAPEVATGKPKKSPWPLVAFMLAMNVIIYYMDKSDGATLPDAAPVNGLSGIGSFDRLLPMVILVCLSIDLILKWWMTRTVAALRVRQEQHRRETKLQKKMVRKARSLSELHPVAIVDEVVRIGRKTYLSGEIAQEEQIYRYTHVLLSGIAILAALILLYQSFQ